MNTAINLYEYGSGGKCVHGFRHTYTGIGEMNLQMEKEFRHIRRLMRTSIDTPSVSIEFVEEEQSKQQSW